MKSVMRSATLFKHGTASQALRLQKSCKVPALKSGHVMIRVKAASINPIDIRMREGYGREIFSRKVQLPWVLGRDFAGTILKVADEKSEVNVGDEVFGIVSPFQSDTLQNGSHAEVICIPETDVVLKPNNVNFLEAASFPYVALTTYTALFIVSKMHLTDYENKKVFVQAGAGGVGSYAVQLLKALGAMVITTCSTGNVSFVKSLGADVVIDYTNQNYESIVSDCDVAYDLLGREYTAATVDTLKSCRMSVQAHKVIDAALVESLQALEKAEDSWGIPQYKAVLTMFDAAVDLLCSATYVSIVSPLMPLTDTHGFHEGMTIYIKQLLQDKAVYAKQGRRYNYSVFQPSHVALKLLSAHIGSGLVKPQIRKTYELAEVQLAHEEVELGHGQGKVMLSLP